MDLVANDFNQTESGFYIKVRPDPDLIHLNNLNVDPLFVDVPGGKLHLQVASPVIDKGDNAAPALPATDMDGEARIADAGVDMGADEVVETDGDGVPDRADNCITMANGPSTRSRRPVLTQNPGDGSTA